MKPFADCYYTKECLITTMEQISSEKISRAVCGKNNWWYLCIDEHNFKQLYIFMAGFR